MPATKTNSISEGGKGAIAQWQKARCGFNPIGTTGHLGPTKQGRGRVRRRLNYRAMRARRPVIETFAVNRQPTENGVFEPPPEFPSFRMHKSMGETRTACPPPTAGEFAVFIQR